MKWKEGTKVDENGARFEDGKGLAVFVELIGINNCWNLAVGIDLDEFRSELISSLNINCMKLQQH